MEFSWEGPYAGNDEIRSDNVPLRLFSGDLTVLRAACTFIKMGLDILLAAMCREMDSGIGQTDYNG